jgi:flagellar biosynthesis/type III secretory pathway M-ring protein FliF/YscJ
MGNFWLKLKIWTKLILVLSWSFTWCFLPRRTRRRRPSSGSSSATTRRAKVPVLQLVLIAFASGVVVTILARTTLRTISQIKELKTRQAAEKRDREIEELKAKAGMLRPKHEPFDENKPPAPKVE